MSLLLGTGTGWVPDIPRKDDPTSQTPEVEELLRAASFEANVALPPRTSLRPSFPPVYDQGTLESCAANAASAVMAYYQQVVCHDSFVEPGHVPSRLFIFKLARNLMGVSGNVGAYLRDTMEALTLFGALHERFWPYDPSLLDIEPPAFCYAYAASYRATRSVRHDPVGAKPEDVVASVKAFVRNGFPSVFGFYLFASIANAASTGEIPMPAPGEAMMGGHAVVVVGYDDEREIASLDPQTGERKVSRGAFEIRNSWGPGWGDGGYGWLPYDYVLRGLTSDWWSLLKAEYLDDDAFGATAIQTQAARNAPIPEPAGSAPAVDGDEISRPSGPTAGAAEPGSAQSASSAPSPKTSRKANASQE